MAHNNKHHTHYTLIAQTLRRLGIAHAVSGAHGNDVVQVAREAMPDAYAVVLELQKVCGPSVIVCWNPVDQLMCVADAKVQR